MEFRSTEIERHEQGVAWLGLGLAGLHWLGSGWTEQAGMGWKGLEQVRPT